MKNLVKLNILLFLSVIACGSEEEPDNTAPGGGSITVEATMNNSIVINIAEASDEGTAVENLTYAAYYTDGVMPEDIGAIINETTPSGGWLAQVGPRIISGLEANKNF